ncbi:response regulator transcription factor [Paenibacillus lemnae]|uniref:Response regulator n=1 Tax=Paenibacillus lemnae TaxID=1330551 RepID=A0A848M3S8_PAELE|nr:response regulator [Paenibacillus lemnae]NMO94909.1 response regulator [Paenibacillus lemnae]
MLRLMIVDDEPIIQEGIRDMIEEENTPFGKILLADDGIDALEKIDYFKPDLIITDIRMPGMDGLEFIRQAQLKKVKRFVILTGHDVFEYARKAIQLQVVDYLLKPVNQQELAELLKRAALMLMEEQQHRVQSAPDVPVNSSRNENIPLMKAYIEMNYMKNISMPDIAEQLNLHPSYAGHLFKKETGNSFVRYLNQVRVDKAKQLLESTQNMPLDKIAKCVGYDNSRTFYKVFRQMAGVTPGEYRKSASQG